jgi:4-diphosphocytidyl-2C-methyl-D-erythritol kinase
LTLVVPARAKLNLDLAVLGRAEDGFHEVRTHIQAVALHDLLELTQADHTSITTSGRKVSGATNNSVLRAHAAMQEEAGRELPTRFHLEKRIPAGSGMGGASSDAAAALRGLAAIHDLKPKADLTKIASAIGADVPFFLTGGAAIAEGRGERLKALPTEQTWYAIAWPDIELLTADVYRAWDEVKGDGSNQLRTAAAHVDRRVHDFAARLGEQWQMTGSGSAFFLCCPNEQEARQATENLDCWTAVTHSVGAWA